MADLRKVSTWKTFILEALVTPINALITDAAAGLARSQNRLLGYPLIADGTTDGKLKTTNNVDFSIGGAVYTKTAADDLWDLSGQTDTTAGQYRAYWLLLDSGGAASVAAGSNAASAAAAIAALPVVASSKVVAGCFVAGPSTDFNGAAGLDAQGDIYNGYPSAYTATAESITLIAP